MSNTSNLGASFSRNVNGVTGADPMILGGELFHRFTAFSIKAGYKMILEPNRHFRDAFIFDTFGVELNLEPQLNGFKVGYFFRILSRPKPD